MDFIKAYTDLLERTEHKELAGDAFSDGLHAAGDRDSFSNDGDIIDFLTRSYVKKAGPDLERMVHSIAQFVIARPEEAVREMDEGMFSTTAPVDLVNMINQYLDIVGRSGVEALQARVLGMCLDGVETYCHDIELHVAGILSGEELVFIVAIANDAEFLVDALDTIEDEYSDLIERRDLEDTFSRIIERCQKLGQLVLHQLCSIIFADLLSLESEMFNKDWVAGITATTDTMLATIEDYFGDFYGKLKTRAFVRLAGYCYNHMILFYVRRLIDNFSKKHTRPWVRSKAKVPPSHDAMNMVSRDLESILHAFQMILEENDHCGNPDRAFRGQIQFSEWVEDILHRTNTRDVHTGVFLSMCTVLKSNTNALSHAYTLVSHLTLLRDFDEELRRWKDMDSMLTEEERKYSPKRPPSRMDVLRMCQGSLAGLYNRKYEDIVSDLDKSVAMAAKRDSILGKTEARNEVAFKEAQVARLREGHGHPLVVRVCDAPREILAQIKHDNELVYAAKKKKASFTWKRAARAHKAMSLAQRLKTGANAAMAQMKTPSKKKKPRNSTSVKVNDAVEQMYREGTITKEEYAQLISQHQKFEEADAQFDDEKAKLAEQQELDEDDPRFMALENARQLLQINAITQQEFDELKATIHSAHNEMNGIPATITEDSDNQSSGSGGESESGSGGGSGSDIDSASSSSSSGSDSDSESSSTKMSEVENEVGAAGVATAISKSNIPNTDPRGKPAKRKSIGVHLADGTDEELDLEQLRGYMMKKPKAIAQWRRRWFSIMRVYNKELKMFAMSFCWAKDHNSPPIKAMPIETLEGVFLTEAQNTFKVVFKPRGSPKKTTLLLTESEKERVKWVTALKKIVQNNRERMKSAFLDNRVNVDDGDDESEDEDDEDEEDDDLQGEMQGDFLTPLRADAGCRDRSVSGSLSERTRSRSNFSDFSDRDGFGTPQSSAETDGPRSSGRRRKRGAGAKSQRRSVFTMPSPSAVQLRNDEDTTNQLTLRPDLGDLRSLHSSGDRLNSTSPETAIRRKKSHSRTGVFVGVKEGEEEEDEEEEKIGDDSTAWGGEEFVSVPARQGGCGACTIS